MAGWWPHALCYFDAKSSAQFISWQLSFQQILGDTNFGQVLIYLMKDANWQALVFPLRIFDSQNLMCGEQFDTSSV